jgi:lipopolysaccharide/colanic/teichoic acid biosynthesis glycosyltransferase
MSLVGPRAYYPDEYEEQSKKYPHCQKYFKKVFQIKPGITGLWQVSGRSLLNFEEWMALDLFYVDNWSFKLDLQILSKTIKVVLRGTGAM